MHDSGRYKVISRTRFTLIMAILISVVAVGVWLGLDRLAEYTKQLEGLAVADPAEAAATLTQLLRALAILNGIVLSLLALWIIRHGRRGWQTASMPRVTRSEPLPFPRSRRRDLRFNASHRRTSPWLSSAPRSRQKSAKKLTGDDS